MIIAFLIVAVALQCEAITIIEEINHTAAAICNTAFQTAFFIIDTPLKAIIQ
jgi:hypothetical protein